MGFVEIFRHLMSPFLAGALAVAASLCIQFIFFSADVERRWRRFLLELVALSFFGGALAGGLQWAANRYPTYLR